MTPASCRNCGVGSPLGARFCAECGASLDGGAPGARRGAWTGRLAGVAVTATIVVAGGVGLAVVVDRPSPAATVVTASPSPVPSATPIASLDITFDPTVPTAIPPVARDRTARLGEHVAVLDDTGERLGWVRVVDSSKYTSFRGLDAPSRQMWVGAKVEYLADSGIGYADLDWVVHDADGTRYEPTAFALDPILGLGALASGQRAAGWVAFEVPRATRHLWAAFVNLDGGVVFNVLLF